MAEHPLSTPFCRSFRLHREADADVHGRNAFDRDRDRLTHSRAFRRLQYKTQVFVCHESDHYRNRLTHTLEVAQIARSIARQLDVKEELTEALALAHDIGHPPFGHIGERALDDVVKKYGGFEHNAQSFLTVAKLEKSYIDFTGLNLTAATIDGIVKHSGIKTLSQNSLLSRFIQQTGYNNFIDNKTQPSLEAQIASISDDIAYNSHDIDDGIRAELFTFDDMGDYGIKIIEKFRRIIDEEITKSKLIIHQANDDIISCEVIRRLINHLIRNVVQTTKKHLKKNNVQNYYDIIHHNSIFVRLSDEVENEVDKIRRFLHEKMYNNAKITDIDRCIKTVIANLFTYYYENFDKLPLDWRDLDETKKENKARNVCNFIAGMTDRYAYRKFHEIYNHPVET